MTGSDVVVLCGIDECREDAASVVLHRSDVTCIEVSTGSSDITARAIVGITHCRKVVRSKCCHRYDLFKSGRIAGNRCTLISCSSNDYVSVKDIAVVVLLVKEELHSCVLGTIKTCIFCI